MSGTLHDFTVYMGTICTAWKLLLLLSSSSSYNDADSNWAPAISVSSNVQHEVRYGPNRHFEGEICGSFEGHIPVRVWVKTASSLGTILSSPLPTIAYLWVRALCSVLQQYSLHKQNFYAWWILLEKKIISGVTKFLFFYRSPRVSTILSKKSRTRNLMTVRSMGSRLYQRTDRHDEATSIVSFSRQFCAGPKHNNLHTFRTHSATISVAVLLLCRHFRPAGLSVSCRSQTASNQNVHVAIAASFTVEEILLSHINLQRYSPSAHAVNQR